MPYRIQDIRLHISQDEGIIKKSTARTLGVGEEDILSLRIVKESIDARDKQDIFFHYTMEATLRNEEALTNKLKKGKSERIIPTAQVPTVPGEALLKRRPVIIGTGPAGLFAGIVLSQAGYRPLLIDRGKTVSERDKDVAAFWKGGTLHPDSNVQFGEGGAGTYSDGKLTTRIKDSQLHTVLEHLVAAGAPEYILYGSKAHIGTDLLKTVVVNLRQTILDNGGTFLFESRLLDIEESREDCYRMHFLQREDIETNCVILALGHSARDTYTMLHQRGFPIMSKPFSVGIRIEHPQHWLDANQYGPYAGHPRLGAADYKLTHQDRETGRGVYTFCMCPGGVVVAAASEEDHLVTNGMSYHARNGALANSAVVTTVSEKDFPSGHPLAGMEYQRNLEHQAYLLGYRSFMAPAQRFADFQKRVPTDQWGSIIPTYRPGVIGTNLWSCLPDTVAKAILNGILAFDRKIPGFANRDAVLTGVETRTSAPIRIKRQEDLCVDGFPGIYAVGEGAGYAGGIVSAAVDGIHAAQSIIKKFKPPLHDVTD